MKTPHKHAKLIKAWADGAEIQFYDVLTGSWKDCKGEIFLWNPTSEYRIKPEPDRVEQCSLHMNLGWRYGQPPEHLKHAHHYVEVGEFKLTFDGATGKLKSAEVI